MYETGRKWRTRRGSGDTATATTSAWLADGHTHRELDTQPRRRYSRRQGRQQQRHPHTRERGGGGVRGTRRWRWWYARVSLTAPVFLRPSAARPLLSLRSLDHRAAIEAHHCLTIGEPPIAFARPYVTFRLVRTFAITRAPHESHSTRLACWLVPWAHGVFVLAIFVARASRSGGGVRCGGAGYHVIWGEGGRLIGRRYR